ncbi:hypothetical protein [Azospirillum isscasi]|uniref:Uncharacterized protein n=1 Tax=Azospirillum isscasi TaxID=3053926 RepID=A0ABU0WDS2_9PROT|nr:hypothetical protein [Azospirillum isscasi]MDQ2102336.1 hypothetical protein [Azospirillum isscasi]
MADLAKPQAGIAGSSALSGDMPQGGAFRRRPDFAEFLLHAHQSLE